jgi:hypothetical protein
MKRLKKSAYTVENTTTGAIVTGNPEAMVTVNEFLRFQIKDHRTGDSLQSCESQS